MSEGAYYLEDQIIESAADDSTDDPDLVAALQDMLAEYDTARMLDCTAEEILDRVMNTLRKYLP